MSKKLHKVVRGWVTDIDDTFRATKRVFPSVSDALVLHYAVMEHTNGDKVAAMDAIIKEAKNGLAETTTENIQDA